MEGSIIIHENEARMAIEMLNDEQLGRLFKSLCAMAYGDAEPELTGVEKYAFLSFKNRYIADKSRYEKVVERNRANGAKGGRPKNPSEPNKTQNNPKNPVGYLETQENPSEPKKPDMDLDMDIDLDIDIDNSLNRESEFSRENVASHEQNDMVLIGSEKNDDTLNIEIKDKEKSSAKKESKTIEERKNDFMQEVADKGLDKYPREMLRAFFDYWTEHNENGRKMRFEMQKVFNISGRLATWYNKEKNKIANGNNNQGSIAERLARIDECLIAQGVQLPR